MFLSKLEESIQSNALFLPNERLLLGVSGGTDSMALLNGLHELAKKYGWQIDVVHVNHQLRGEASKRDAEYVAHYCAKRQIPFEIKLVDVQKVKTEQGGNKQAIARKLRYEVFRQVAKARQIKKLVLAHHADDQVETVLMRIIRGTGPSGLTGISTIREWGDLQIVRPLRDIYRKEMEDYLRLENIVPREDVSNRSIHYTRNRLRLQLIPELMDYNPQVKQSLLQLSKLMEEEERVWEEWTTESLKSVATHKNENDYYIDLSQFLTLPVALQRRTVKLILSYLVSKSEKSEVGMETTPEISYFAVDQVLYLATHPSPSVWIFLPGGIKGVRSYDSLRLTKEYIDVAEQKWCCSLQVPGITYLTSGMIESSVLSTSTNMTFETKYEVYFDADKLPLDSLLVRNRRPGDRMRPFGFSGHKQIKSIFMEMKIPVEVRDKKPLVVAGEDIIWIPGIRRSIIAPVSDQTTRILRLIWSPEFD